jgi:hypothetical protein
VPPVRKVALGASLASSVPVARREIANPRFRNPRSIRRATFRAAAISANAQRDLRNEHPTRSRAEPEAARRAATPNADNARHRRVGDPSEAFSDDSLERNAVTGAQSIEASGSDPFSLVSVTQLGRRGYESVRVTMWPECGEATVVYCGGAASRVETGTSAIASSHGLMLLADQLREQERLLQSQRARVSRARGRIRRYVVRNMLTRMWTLTFADREDDRAVALASMQEFGRRLREHFGEAIPYLYVFEVHPKRGGWHVHLLTQSRYVKKKVLERLWGHGLVQYSDGPKRHARSKREAARGCARYAAKYVGKDIDEGLPANVHAYEPAQGFQPERVARSTGSMRDGFGMAVRQFDGLAPSHVWDSATSETWSGPPVTCLRFDDGGG